LLASLARRKKPAKAGTQNIGTQNINFRLSAGFVPPFLFSLSCGKIPITMIAQTFDEAFAQIKTLADRFQKDEKQYLETTYQEAHVRQHFLDKFFVALGWDVYHFVG